MCTVLLDGLEMDGWFSCTLVDSDGEESIYTGLIHVPEGSRRLLLIASSRKILAPGVDLSFVPLPADHSWTFEELQSLVRVAAIFRGSVAE